MKNDMFTEAVPVWGDYDRDEDMLNRHLVFRESLSSLRGRTLSIAAADFYRLTVNGEFVGFGPARTAEGYARVDVYDMSRLTEAEGENLIVIEVAGFFCKSMSTVWQPSFLCAEINADGAVEKFTGRDFACYEDIRYVRQVERYSVQRHFGEIRDERVGSPFLASNSIKAVPVLSDIKFIPRRVPFAACDVFDMDGYASFGVFSETEDGRAGSGEFGTGEKQNAYSFDPMSVGAFDPGEVLDKPYRYVGGLEKTKMGDDGKFPMTLHAGQWVVVDFKRIYCGFIRVCADVRDECDLVIAFSELCEDGCFSFRRISMQGVLEYKLPTGGGASVESFEPHTFRQIAVFVKTGTVTLSSVGCRSFERDRAAAIPRSFKRAEHNEIYEAALRSFAHNAVDLFTDCPSRERAGWLCDSYFMGQAEYFLYGEVPIEDAFLENYLLFRNDGTYPEGALPMCYPSTPTENGRFIPQWNMWYVLEVCEYLCLRRPDFDREVFRPSVVGVLDFLRRYENSDGLLEGLPSWNFVEWSDANLWTQDVSYPTNFLYSEVLSRAALTFSMPELLAKAESVRARTLEMSFDGGLFVDHAIRRRGGELENQRHISEACQYYAILFGHIDLEEPKYSDLLWQVKNDFRGFSREGYKFCPKNAFIGLYLRMMVLINMNERLLLAENLDTFCLHMSRTTGTLWEYKDGTGSLDHGFASFAALTIPFADSLYE